MSFSCRFACGLCIERLQGLSVKSRALPSLGNKTRKSSPDPSRQTSEHLLLQTSGGKYRKFRSCCIRSAPPPTLEDSFLRYSRMVIWGHQRMPLMLFSFQAPFDTEYDRFEGSTVQRKRSHVAPESLKALCFQTHGRVRARYDTALPPLISIVLSTGRPVMSVPEPFLSYNP